MLINGKDLENYSCSLIDRKITPTEVITYNEWLDGAIQPTFVRQQDGFKTIEVVLIMKAESELDAQYLISELTRDAKKCEVNFDEDMDELYYDCVQPLQWSASNQAFFRLHLIFKVVMHAGKGLL